MAETKPTASVKATSVQPKKAVTLSRGSLRLFVLWQDMLSGDLSLVIQMDSLIRLRKDGSGQSTKVLKVPSTGSMKVVSSYPY